MLLASLIGACGGELDRPAQHSSALYDDNSPPPPPANPSIECNGDPGTNLVCTCNSGPPINNATTANKFINNAARWAGFSNFIVSGSGNGISFPNIINTSQYWAASNSLQPSGLGVLPGGAGFSKWFPNPSYVTGSPSYSANGDYYAILVYWNNANQCAYWMNASNLQSSSINAGRVPRAIYAKFEQLGFDVALGPPIANPRISYSVAGLSGVSHQVFAKGVITTKSGQSIGNAIVADTIERDSLRWAYLWDHVIDAFDAYAPARKRYSYNKMGLPLAGNVSAATCSSYHPGTGGCLGSASGWTVRTVVNPWYDTTYAIKLGAVTVPGLAARGAGVGSTLGVIEDTWRAAYPGSTFGKPFTGALGYPIGRELINESGIVQQNFENGYITWTPQNGAVIFTPGLCSNICTSASLAACNEECWHRGAWETCTSAGLPASSHQSALGEIRTFACDRWAPEQKVRHREDLEMKGSRLSNVMLTKYLEYPQDSNVLLTTNSQGRIRFGTTCNNWRERRFDDLSSNAPDGDENISDSSMIVVARGAGGSFLTTLYNDDPSVVQRAAGVSVGGNGKGSYVEFQGQASTNYRFTIYVYSNRLNTSRCELGWSNASTSVPDFASLVSPRHIGGALVRVGPVHGSDYFEVETRDDGATANSRTQMDLFQIPRFENPAAPKHGGTVNGASCIPGTNDCDAKVSVGNIDYTKIAENYLLVGKLDNRNDASVSPQTDEIMLRADIVRGPLSPTKVTGSVNGTLFSPVLLTAAGRYTLGIEVMVDCPVGDRGCSVGLNPRTVDGETVNRGRLNGPALEYAIKFGKTTDMSTWTYATPIRKIPMGAFGGTGVHRFYHEVDVSNYIDENGFFASYYYAPVVTLSEGVTIASGEWFAQRNAESSQLRVATLNMWYDSAALRFPGELNPDDREYTNAADLLGPRGEPQPDTDRGTNSADDWAFSDPEVRGPFQWNSDIVHLTEFGDSIEAFGGADGGDFYSIFRRQRDAFYAGAEDDRSWAHMFGRDEDLFTMDGGGAVFVASSQWPGTAPESLALVNSGVPSGTGTGECYSAGSEEFSCFPDETNQGHNTGFIPARTAVRSSLANQQPILVLGAHLDYDDISNVYQQVVSMCSMIPDLLGGQWNAMNRGGVPGADHQNNRMIIIGDLNMDAQKFGDHYRFVDRLRETFGYAVDVAMAIDNSYGADVATGMHDVGPANCYQSKQDWWALPAPFPKFNPVLDLSTCGAPGLLQVPWWARTYRGKCFGINCSNDVTRNDFIILVGRGWEFDDPVRAYRVMQNVGTRPNPLAPPVPGLGGFSAGVNFYRNGTTTGGNYKPRVDIGDGTSEGSAAIETDHTAVGATLRIWAGDSPR